MSTFIAQACINLRPNAGVSVDENGIHWHSIDESGIPSEAEITAEADRLQAEYDAKEYRRQRVAEYPDYRDYLDGIVKGDQAQVQAYIDACLAVKAKYPKPADEVTE
jgi:hypothetical protein